MNRKERRNMEKQLGLRKHYAKETREEKFSRWADNIENGKRLQEETAEKVRVSQQEQADKKADDIIASKAEYIARTKNIPLIDAMVEAQSELSK